MQTEVTLRLIPELDHLTKAINKVTKDTEKSLSKSLDKPIDNLRNKINKELDFGKSIIGPKLPDSALNNLRNKLKEAASVKLDLDFQDANLKLDSMRYQILGTYATFKGLIEKPLSVAMEFETSMSDVKKVVDFKSKDELNEFQNEIWNLTKTIPLAAKDLTNIVASGGQLGIDKNILIPFTDVVAKMSTAFDMSTSEAGETIAGLMKKMGIGIDDVKDLGDAINYIGAKSAGSPREVVNILGRIGGMAKTLGLSSEQTAGLAGAFANMKIPAEQSATAINKMLGVLGSADMGTANFKKAINQIGFDAIELKQIMADNPLQGIINVLKGIESVNDSDKIGILKNLFGEEAGPKIAQITSNMNEFEKILSLVSKKENYINSMQDEFDEVSKTTSNSMQLMKNSFARIANSIGSIFLPPLSLVLKKISDISHNIAEFVEKNRTLATIITSVIGGLFALKTILIGVKMASALSTLALYPLQKAFISSTLLVRSFGNATALFSRIFGISMLSIKGAIISTGIGALMFGIGASIYYVLNNWEYVSSKLIAIWSNLKTYISSILDWISDKFSFVTDFIGITDSGSNIVYNNDNNLNTNGVIDKTILEREQSLQNFYTSNNLNRQINDNKTIYINTSSNPDSIAKAIYSNSYSYLD